jgi:TP901 family phage tail tape measure protein
MAADFDVTYKVKPDEASLKAGAKKIEENFKDVTIGIDVDKSDISKTAKYIKNEFEDAGHKAGKGFGEKFKTGFGSIGNIVAGLGIGNLASSVLGFVKNSATAAIELDKQVKNIGTLGVKNFEEFSAKAIELSKTVPDSAANIASAVYEAVSAGITGTNDDIMKFVAVASKAGVAGMTDTGTAVNGLTSVLNAYKRPVEDAAAVSNELFAGVKLGKITFEEFVAGLGDAVPTAAALGVGFDEVSASIATITSQGVRAPMAFTKLNQVMIELQKPGTDLAKVMKGVTVEVGGVSQQLTESNISQVIKQQGLTETLRQIGISAEEMGTSITAAFSSSDAGAAAVLLAGENAAFAAEMLRKTREEIKAGAAEQAFNIANQSIDVQLKLLQNNLQAALQPIFANVLPIVVTLAKSIAGIFNNPAIQKAIQAISSIIGELLTTVLPPLIDVLAPLLAGLLQMISPVAEQLGKLIAAVLPQFNKILEPLITMLPQIGEAFGKIIDAIVPIVNIIFDELSPVLADLIRDLMPIIIEQMKTWAIIFKELTPTIKILAHLLANVLTGSLKIMMPIILRAVKEIGELAKEVTGVINVVTDVVGFFVGSGGGPFGDAMDAMGRAAKRNVQPITDLNNALLEQQKTITNIANLNKIQSSVNDKLIQNAEQSGFVANPFMSEAETLKAAIEWIKIRNKSKEKAEKTVGDKTKTDAGGGDEKAAVKSLDEQIRANTELIAQMRLKGNMVGDELLKYNMLIVATQALIKEQKLHNFSLERARQILDGTFKEGKPFVFKESDINSGLAKLSDITKNNPLEMSYKLIPVDFDLTPIVDYFEEQMKSITPVINEFAMSISDVFKTTSKESQKAMKEASNSYEQDSAKLKKELLSKEISLEEFQQQSEDIEQSRADKIQSIYEQMNDKIVESFENMADRSNELIKELLTNRLSKNVKEGGDLLGNFGDDMTAVMGVVALSVGATLGTMIASGTANFGDYLRAMLIAVIDTATAMVNAYFAAALMKDATVFGLSTGWTLAILAASNVALAVARGLVGQIGADEGVIGINERYNKQASNRDTIPIWVRKGESILTPEFTSKHEDLLAHLYGGRSEESYFRQNYIQPVSNYSVNQSGDIVKTNKALLRAIENGIEVKSTNINKIKIVDKTSNGIKYANFR